MESSSSIIPPDEDARLAAVHRYEILDTPCEGAFDRITLLAARLFRVPIAIVSIVDVSSPDSHPATRRSQEPISTPPRTPARIADRSSTGTNPPGADSSGPAGTAALTGPAPAAGNPA